MVAREASDSGAMNECEEAGRQSQGSCECFGLRDYDHAACYHKSNVPVKELF